MFIYLCYLCRAHSEVFCSLVFDNCKCVRFLDMWKKKKWFLLICPRAFLCVDTPSDATNNRRRKSRCLQSSIFPSAHRHPMEPVRVFVFVRGHRFRDPFLLFFRMVFLKHFLFYNLERLIQSVNYNEFFKRFVKRSLTATISGTTSAEIPIRSFELVRLYRGYCLWIERCFFSFSSEHGVSIPFKRTY